MEQNQNNSQRGRRRFRPSRRHFFLICLAGTLFWVYSVLSFSDLTYFFCGTVLRRPFESKAEYLIRSLLFLSHEHMHNPKMYQSYRDDLEKMEWEDVKGELIRKYVELGFGVRSNYGPRQMVWLWPDEVKAECEKIMENPKLQQQFTPREYVKLLFLHLTMCNEDPPGEKSIQTCRKIKEVFKTTGLTYDSWDQDLWIIEYTANEICPDPEDKQHILKSNSTYY